MLRHLYRGVYCFAVAAMLIFFPAEDLNDIIYLVAAYGVTFHLSSYIWGDK